MSKELMNLAENRTPEIIGAEIRDIQDKGRVILLYVAVEIGRRLKEAKGMLGHGEWLPWLKSEARISSSTAANYIKLFDEYAPDQLGIFGAAPNFQTFGNLSVSNALRLLAVPAEDREEFAAANNVEGMSARELDRLLKEKAKAEEDAAKAREEADRAAEAVLAADMAATKAKEDLEREREAAEGAAMELERLRDENRELKNRPVPVTVERDEAAIEEAAKAARAEEAALWENRLQKEKEDAAGRESKAAEDARAALQKKLDKAKAQVEKYRAEAEKAAGGAQEQADAARKEAEKKASAAEQEMQTLKAERDQLAKQLRLSSPEATAFSLTFKAAQENMNRLFELLEDVRQKDGSTAERFTAALRVVLDQFTQRLSEYENGEHP